MGGTQKSLLNLGMLILYGVNLLAWSIFLLLSSYLGGVGVEFDFNTH